jgi:glucokinase
MKEYSIGIDIGGTKILAGIVSRSGKVIYRETIPTPRENREGIFYRLHQLIRSHTKVAEENGMKLQGIGVGTAGQIDFERGRVLSGTTNIVDWNDVPLRDELGKHSSLPIWVDNDVNAVALAEHRLGAARGEAHVICLTLGTGVGGGIITDGRLIRGSWGGASELGHVSIDLNGPKCNCGFQGCLETYASGTGIARIMREKLAAHIGIESPASLLYQQNPSLITSHLVFQWMKEGDKLAQEAVQEMIRALSFGLISFIHTFNPTMVILGGGMMKNGEWIREAVEKQVRTLGIRSLVAPVKIRTAELGSEAGLIGAAYQSWVYNN